MHTPRRPNGDIFNRMVSGAAMPDAECAAQTKRIHAAGHHPRRRTLRTRRARPSNAITASLGHLGGHSHPPGAPTTA